jgi:hypothetical protein
MSGKKHAKKHAKRHASGEVPGCQRIADTYMMPGEARLMDPEVRPRRSWRELRAKAAVEDPDFERCVARERSRIERAHATERTSGSGRSG